MMTFLMTLPVWAGLGVYLRLLSRWWPVLDDPDYFVRQQLEEDDKARWAKALNVGLSPIVSWHSR